MRAFRRRLISASPGGAEATPLPGRRRDVGLEGAASSITWFHSIDLGDRVVSAGIKSPETLQYELDLLGLPEDMSGLSVLDIGAWDGFFSFEAERRGADRVVALDHFAWALDHVAQRRYNADCVEQGIAPLPYEQVPGLLDVAHLPGRAGFDLAHKRLHSRVEAVVGDFTEMDVSRLGKFDVVLFLGVLYHLENPLRALRRLPQVTRGRAIIETVCAVFPGFEAHQMFQFFSSDELNDDPSNWWAPNETGLVAMCHAAGFAEVNVRAAPRSIDPPNPGCEFHYGRAVIEARATEGDAG